MSSLLKNILFKTILICLISILGSTIASATHIAGGELTYKCLGNSMYEVTLVVRRDCANGAADAQFDDPGILGIFGSLGALQIGLGDDRGRSFLELVSQRTLHNGLLDDCKFMEPGDGVCVSEAIYKAIVELPWNKQGYILTYQRCCRNSILTNINDPLETGATYYSHVSADALRECNTQPTFNDWPEIYTCVNDKFTFDHSAMDNDGDELVYRLCTPSTGSTIDNPTPNPPTNPPYFTVDYAGNFSTMNMFGGSQPLTIDPATGLLCGTPSEIGVYLIGVCVDEYRNGVLLSTVRRDFEIHITACGTPIITDCDIVDNNCDGDNTISFVNRTTGADTYTWYFDYPNQDPAFTSNEVNPTFTYPTAGKYTVRKEATRLSNSCTVHEDFIVSVGTTNTLSVDFDATLESCNTGENIVRLTDRSIDPTGLTCAVDWSWVVTINGQVESFQGESILVSFGSSDEATVDLTVTGSNGCISQFSKTINVNDIGGTNSRFDSQIGTCLGTGFELILTDASTSPLSTSWVVTDNGISTSFSGSPLIFQTTSNSVEVTLSNEFAGGCFSEITRTINPQDLLPIINGVNVDNTINCDNSSDVIFTPQITNTNGINGTVLSYEWTLSDGTTSTSSQVNTQLDLGEQVQIDLTITYDNGCQISLVDFIHTNNNALPILSITPTAQGTDCGDGLVIFTPSLAGANGLTISSYSWTTNSGLNSTSSSFDLSLAQGVSETINLTVILDNGCSISLNGATGFTYTGTSITSPILNIQETNNCDQTPVSVTLTDITNATGFLVTSYNWTIDGVQSNQSEVTIIPSNVGTQVSLVVAYANGCESEYFKVFFSADYNNSASYTIDNVMCANNNITVTFNNTSVNFLTEQWVINGMTFSSSPITLVFAENENVNLSLIVENGSNCQGQIARSFNISEEVFPNLDIISNLNVACLPVNGDLVTFTPRLSGGFLGNPTGFNWTYEILGVGPVNTSTANSVSLNLLPGQEVKIDLIADFADGCSVTQTQTFIGGTTPELDVIKTFDCTDPTAPSGTLQDVTILPPGVSITSSEWFSNGQLVGTGTSITLVLQESVVINYIVNYSNGCSAQFETTLDPEETISELSWDFSIVECLDDMVVYEFFNNGDPGCLTVESISWVINGQTYFGNPVLVTLPIGQLIDVSMTINYTNGTTTSTAAGGTVSTSGVITTIPTTIVDLIDSIDCSNMLNLEIENPDGSVGYEWSTDENFDEIIGLGPILDTEFGPGFEGVIYVRTTDGNCASGSDQINLTNFSIQLELPVGFTICPGDSTFYSVNNLDSTQNVTYLWKGDQVISGNTDSNPIIGIADGETDPFSLILCTSNQFGCERSDTIEFNPELNEPLQAFTYEPDSCGSLTINFDANNTFSGVPFWDFGDGTTLSDSITTSHVFTGAGMYTVTLSDLSEQCPAVSYSETIMVPTVPIIAIDTDTLIYTNDTAILDADITGGNNEDVTWCLLNRDTIGSGVPFTYMPEQDTVMVLAKIINEFGCEGIDSLLIIRRPSFPPNTSIGEIEDQCTDGTFTIPLNFSGNEEEYTYLWGPAECIVDGINTEVPTASANSSKEFTVIITQISSGLTETYSTFVNVQNPAVAIVSNNGIPGQENEPTVCLGSPLDLASSTLDATCDYIWTYLEDGVEVEATGDNIEVTPTENTTYTLVCRTPAGCESSASQLIEVVPPQCNEDDVFIPSAFSPNGDNVNDVLFVRSKFIQDMEFFVLDRWGKEVYRTLDKGQGWDGTLNGKSLAPDVYAYCLKATCFGGTEYVVAGNVSIMK